MTNKNDAPVIAMAGVFQRGKSMLINCLLAEDIADIGEGLPTTHVVGKYSHGDEGVFLHDDDDSKPKWFRLDDYWDIHQKHQLRLEKWKKEGSKKEDKPKGSFDSLRQVSFTLPRKNLLKTQLMDTPGVNSEDKSDTERTFKALEDEADFIIMLVSDEKLGQTQQELIQKVCLTKKPFIVVMNCRDEGYWSPENERNIDVAKDIESDIDATGQSPWTITKDVQVWRCNILWYWCAMLKKGNHPDTGRFASKLDTEWTKTIKYFTQRNKPVPELDELARLSNVQPLIDFITGTSGTKARNLPALLAIHGAYNEYRNAIIQKINQAKEIITG